MITLNDKTCYLAAILFILLNFSCIGSGIKKGIQNGADTTQIKKNLKHSVAKAKVQRKKNLTLSDYDEMLRSYKDTIKLDTIIILNSSDTLNINLKHFCTYDNEMN